MTCSDAEVDALAEEFVRRARRGDAPAIDEYVASHPHLEADIRELFPVLEVVEGLKRSARDRAAREFRLPTTIRGYRVGRELGRGGMGRVYEGWLDPPVDGVPSRVALKVVHPHLLSRVEFVARFLREAEAGRRVRHPNVVRTLDLGLVEVDGDEVPFLVLEHVQGQTLRALLDEVEVAPERLCRHVGVRIADALAAVHGAGFIHRDVKPENVVITASEQVKLMDLGVAVHPGGEGRVTRDGGFVGSVLYASASQLRGDEPDAQWDLYALGVLLFELATGRHPASVGPPSRWAPDLSPFYDAVVGALLWPDGVRRFDSAASLRVALHDGEDSDWWQRQDRTTWGGARRALPEATTPLRGRIAESSALDDLLADARNRCGRTVLIVGEAGIGKTRLVDEWVAALGKTTAPRLLCVRHAPDVGGGGIDPLGPELWRHVGGAGGEARVRALLATRGPLLEPMLHHLRGDLQGGVEREVLTAGLARLMAGLAEERPLVAVFEDLHYASQEERARFVELSRALESSPVLLLGTVRDKPCPSWLSVLDGPRGMRRIELGPLDRASCRQVVRDVVPTGVDLPADVDALLERSDHNPLFLVELAREVGRRGGKGEAPMPVSVRELLGARLAALDADDRELLEAAACCGFEFDPLLVSAAAGVGPVAALKRFGRLHREQGLVRPTARHYRFQHHLLQEVLYDGLHEPMRVAYHRALAEALAARPLGGSGASEGRRALALCHHRLAGGLPAEARPHLRRALEHLEWERHDSRGAERLAERAFSQPAALDVGGRAMGLWLRGRAIYLDGRSHEAEPVFEEALLLCRERGDPKLEMQVLRSLGHCHRAASDPTAMERAYRQAASLAARTDDPGSAAMPLGSLAIEWIYRDRLDEAEALLHEAFRMLAGHEDPLRRGRLTTYLARIFLRRGQRAEAARLFERARRLAHGAGDLPTEAVNRDGLGQLAFVEGRYADAVHHAEQSMALKRQTGMVRRPIDALANLALCLTHLGRFDEALAAAEEAVAHALGTEDAKKIRHAHMRRSAVHFVRGELALARSDLDVALARLGEDGRVAFQASCVALGVDVLGSLGRVEEAWRLHEGSVPAGRPDGGERRGGRLEDARARLLEVEGRWAEARAAYVRVRSRTATGEAARASAALSLARLDLQRGDTESARCLLHEARAWGRASGAHAFEVLANVYLALGDGHDLLGPRVALEQHAARLPWVDRIAALAALRRHGGGVEDLRAAWDLLSRVVAAAPAADRETMIERVALHREVAEAARRDARPSRRG